MPSDSRTPVDENSSRPGLRHSEVRESGGTVGSSLNEAARCHICGDSPAPYHFDKFPLCYLHGVDIGLAYKNRIIPLWLRRDG